jgi:branched-chain amino acid transport system ATP-binding protein
MLKLDKVTISYGKTEVVHGVSLEVKPGEIVTIIGANGAGKSTILNTITGLHKADSGSILFQEKEVAALRANRLVKEGMRLVPEGRQIFPAHTVLENLLLGAHIEKNSQKIERRLEEVFQRFPRLKERQKQMGGTLSGGEQQMLAIGRALMTAPTLVILDEPSLGLAPIITAEVFDLLKNLRQSGITILLVEQMANSALKISDRAYVLKTGNVVFSGTAIEVMQDNVLVKAYLGNV